jgi:hypothetical protein
MTSKMLYVSGMKTESEFADVYLNYVRKALPVKIDYEKLSPYFTFRPHDVIHHTLRQTTQLAKSTIHYPMRHHLKSRFQMLRHKRLNEVIATDTYYVDKNQLKAMIVHKYFWNDL